MNIETTLGLNELFIAFQFEGDMSLLTARWHCCATSSWGYSDCRNTRKDFRSQQPTWDLRKLNSQVDHLPEVTQLVSGREGTMTEF